MVVPSKALLISGGATTTSVAVAGGVGKTSEAVRGLVVLTFTPALAPVTLTEIVHPPADVLPPVRLTAVDPAVNPVKVPPQLFTTVGNAATCRPAGSESLNAILVRAIEGGVTVNISVETC